MKKVRILLIAMAFLCIAGIGSAALNANTANAANAAEKGWPPIHIDEIECIACGSCAWICPVSAIIPIRGTYVVTTDCIVCGWCIDACPVGAITKEWSISSF